MNGFKFACLGMVIASRAAYALTLGFDNAGDRSGDYAGSSEQGFQIVPQLADWTFLFNYGWPAPCLYFGRPRMIYNAKIRFKRTDGGLFTFQSFDANPTFTYAYYVFGYRSGQQVLLDIDKLDVGEWLTYSIRKTVQVDTIVLDFRADRAEDLLLDNLVVNPVPEPAGWFAVASGIALLTLRSRIARGHTRSEQGLTSSSA